MELRDYIDEAAKKAGSVSALARMLGLNQPDVSNAKAMKKRLPNQAVVEIADYIGADLKAVIAANELVTEKDEVKRAFWSPFVQHAKAASYVIATSMIITAHEVQGLFELALLSPAGQSRTATA